MRLRSLRLFAASIAVVAIGFGGIPLPEHPRPDFERAAWINLNGEWNFQFDAANEGVRSGWAARTEGWTQRITVPFPWGAPLSGVKSEADIAWYQRNITIPEAWRGQKVFLVVGASDWVTQGWLDGRQLGTHRGGYTPFEFELTPHVTWGQPQSVVLRVDDTPQPFKLEGKQGYGPAKGIWQTVYLEARPVVHLQRVHFTPDVDRGAVHVRATLSEPAPAGAALRLHFKTGGQPVATLPVAAGSTDVHATVSLTQPRLWSLEDPFLYELDVSVGAAAGGADRVSTYFGLRKINVVNLPGTDFPYVALNGKPVYLQLSLDQSYHPEGFYTFPTDQFMRDEILRSKRLGLNGNRVHIKVEVPRKLYWADKLGLLIMADLPNSWGEPSAEAKQESDYTLRQMIDRDFNHPSIFSWVVFNETWGLQTKQPDGQKVYLPETQAWVVDMYRLTKALDPTRLVEDNSPNLRDHTETDLNTWHDYLPGYAWREQLDQITRDTFPGSTWNFIGGRKQDRQPLLNSECGNVWGYDGSTGDVDWSWDYHIMLNEFRRHPKVAGWLYTEHHDVINEWNGYFRYDRTEKFTGLEEFVPGMTLRDLHSAWYVAPGGDLCRETAPGATVEVPIHLSALTSEMPGASVVLRSRLHGWDFLGRHETYGESTQRLRVQPWMARDLAPLRVTMPEKRALAVLAMTVETDAGLVLHRNFTTFTVGGGEAARSERRMAGGGVPAEAGATSKAVAPALAGTGSTHLLRFAPASFADARWSQKQWAVLDGRKVNGAGHGHFEYHVAWPDGLAPAQVGGATLVFEASAKRLHGKDRPGATYAEADFMRGAGSHDPSANPNSYPMTDTTPFPSEVRVRINGIAAETLPLRDDPADHRGVLSWHAQLRDKKLREAGSYGYLLQVTLPAEAWRRAAAEKRFVVRFEVDPALPGGLAIYGEKFGRYPLDPTLVLSLRDSGEEKTEGR